MKKFLLSLLSLCTLGAQADEGMWTLFDLPPAVFKQMQAEGYSLPYEMLYANSGAISNAVVNFGGFCSGVVVSPDGLVFTNHHCGFSCINAHSTVEHDYMTEGFYARTLSDELPNKTLFVSFMVKQEDITARVKNMLSTVGDSRAQSAALDSLENHLSDSISKEDKTLRAEVKAYYQRNRYYLTYYRDFRDVRLVFAPTKSMGKFGGDTDNWMWPRQTCDFSVFRIYADPKTNGPAEYSRDNVPYHPATWARVSTNGYQPGDFAMTMGYPGSTERYLSSYGIRQMRDAENAPRHQVRTIRLREMRRHMDADKKVRIMYDDKYASCANYWKNSLGMNRCIDSLRIIPQKRAYEQRIQEWCDSTGFLCDSLDFVKMDRMYVENYETVRYIYYVIESFLSSTDFSRRAYRYAQRTDEKKDTIHVPKDYFEPLDRDVLAALMDNYRRQCPDALPEFYQTVDRQFKGSCADYAAWLYKKSFLFREGKKVKVGSKSWRKDPGIVFGRQLADFYGKLMKKYRHNADKVRRQEQYLCDAVVRMEMDLPHYSDANFTLRLSYGQVGEFVNNGHPSGYFTDASSLTAKMDSYDSHPNPDYYAEKDIRSLIGSGNYGPYGEDGSLRLCFLTNNDITGGNSGSPVFNGRNELIGLAFDGNWESLSGDIYFNKTLQRCICVDIRFVLFMMDRWGHADRLIRELTGK